MIRNLDIIFNNQGCSGLQELTRVQLYMPVSKPALISRVLIVLFLFVFAVILNNPCRWFARIKVKSKFGLSAFSCLLNCYLCGELFGHHRDQILDRHEKNWNAGVHNELGSSSL
jgi:hypothetical protein